MMRIISMRIIVSCCTTICSYWWLMPSMALDIHAWHAKQNVFWEFSINPSVSVQSILFLQTQKEHLCNIWKVEDPSPSEKVKQWFRVHNVFVGHLWCRLHHNIITASKCLLLKHQTSAHYSKAVTNVLKTPSWSVVVLCLASHFPVNTGIKYIYESLNERYLALLLVWVVLYCLTRASW